jgi:hypothetical protein
VILVLAERKGMTYLKDMEDYTTEELYQITQGLIHQYDTNRGVMNNCKNLPEVFKHWQTKMETAEKAYLKLIVVYNRRRSAELMQDFAAMDPKES